MRQVVAVDEAVGDELGCGRVGVDSQRGSVGVPKPTSGTPARAPRWWPQSARPVVSAPITPPTPAGVQLGATVRARDLDSGEERTWTLVAKAERDPAAGKLSIDSPVGRALVGHEVGDTVLVAAPHGEWRLVIEDVSR